MEPGDSMPHSQGLSKNPYPEPNQLNSLACACRVLRFSVKFLNKDGFYSVRLLASRQTPQAGGPLLVGCPRLLIQYIRRILLRLIIYASLGLGM